MKNHLSGFALINKPVGISSFHAVSVIKKKLGTRKAGHTGTLDPFAEGLLIILFGDMTRFFDYFMKFKKTYRAEAVFGEERDSEDITGTTTLISDFIPDLSLISEKIPLFTGQITQIPSVYSAVHINGKRSYQLARQGIKADIPPRKTFIHSFDINSFDNQILDFTVECSSGTYIRSLARDLARECSSAAYLKSLIRTDIGNFSLKDAFTPDDFSENCLISPYDGIRTMGLNICTVKSSYKAKILNGIIPDSSWFYEENIPEGLSAVFDSENIFTAFIENSGSKYIYRFVVPERNGK